MAGSSQLERAGRQEAEPDVPCTICMSNISHAAYVDGCLHRFCFGRILQRAARRAVCLLCRRPFDRVLHTVRAGDDYHEYAVSASARPPRPVARARMFSHLRPRPGTPGPVRRGRGPAGRRRCGSPAQQDAGERPAEAGVPRYHLEALRGRRLLAFGERR